MSVYFTALLLTLVITALGDYKCRMFSQPANCKNNSRIRISKTDRGTQYRLVLCANNQCCDNTTITFECADICDACKMIVSDRRACSWGSAICERKLDDIFNSYCSVGVTSPATELAPTVTATTFTLPFSRGPAEAIFSSRKDNGNGTVSASATALAVLFCVSVVLLAGVTIGWLCTCWVMNKKADAKKSTVALKGISTNEEEVYLKNPVYDRRAGSTSAAPARAVVAYDVIANPPSQAARTGQAYNILNRGQAGGGQTTDAVAASAGVGSYSQLGPRDGEHHGNKQDLS